jgi:SAM-dependent methyltransferase
MPKGDESVLAYYQNHHFNPVLIRVEDPEVWEEHFAKRRNLYERHLGLPLPLLRGARILEFGPNSGENCLVPALFGGRLTLVEPNDQVLPRLHELLDQFGVSGQVDAVHCQTIDDFMSRQTYDLVIAEGFLYTLPNRDALLRKIIRLIEPGKFGVISFNDQYGGLIELLRRALLFRACYLSGIDDMQSPASLHLAEKLYGDDFSRLNSSRTFDAWWRDTLVNPFYVTEGLWSFPALLAILQEESCEFFASSPVWATFQHYSWYKNLTRPLDRHEHVLRDWRANLAYFLTGSKPPDGRHHPASAEVIQAVATVTAGLSDASRTAASAKCPPLYPIELNRYLAGHTDSIISQVNEELKRVFDALHSRSVDALLDTYAAAGTLRSLWGTAYHYICFQRGFARAEYAAA